MKSETCSVMQVRFTRKFVLPVDKITCSAQHAPILKPVHVRQDFFPHFILIISTTDPGIVARQSLSGRFLFVLIAVETCGVFRLTPSD